MYYDRTLQVWLLNNLQLNINHQGPGTVGIIYLIQINLLIKIIYFLVIKYQVYDCSIIASVCINDIAEITNMRRLDTTSNFNIFGQLIFLPT